MKVVFIGECSIDHYYTLQVDWPQVGSKAKVLSTGCRYGGMVANASAIFANYGGHALLLSGLHSQDPNTPHILADLTDYGVDVSQVKISPHIGTPQCLIVTDGQERIIYVVESQSGVAYLEPINDIQKWIADADFIYSAIREIRLMNTAINDMDTLLDNSGVKLFIDCDAHTEMDDLSVLQKATIVSFNEFGYQKILSKLPEEKLKDILFFQGKIEYIIITKGNKGCTVIGQNETLSMEAFRKDIPPKDTTGSGDAFNSTFLYTMLKGMCVKECMDLANKAGFQATMSNGPRTKISFEDLMALS